MSGLEGNLSDDRLARKPPLALRSAFRSVAMRLRLLFLGVNGFSSPPSPPSLGPNDRRRDERFLVFVAMAGRLTTGSVIYHQLSDAEAPLSLLDPVVLASSSSSWPILRGTRREPKDFLMLQNLFRRI